MNNDRNVKTLIICFVLAIMALIPLRFAEVKNVTNESQTQVLGDETVLEEEEIDDGIELPDAEVDVLEDN